MKEESEKVGLKLSIQKMKLMACRTITSWQIDGEKEETDFIFLGSKITVDSDCSHEIKRHLLLGRKAMTNLDSVLKSRDVTLLIKVHYSQSYDFSSNHVQMWELDSKEGRVLENCFWIDAEEDSWSPLDSKEIKPVNSKGNQPWIFIGGTDADAEAPKLWPPDAKSWLIGKDPDAEKYSRQKEKRAVEDEMVT